MMTLSATSNSVLDRQAFIVAVLAKPITELAAYFVSKELGVEINIAQQYVHDAVAAGSVNEMATIPRKDINWDCQKMHRVALRIAYIGTAYSGLAVQKDTKETVEEYLFHALEKTRLISSRAGCHFDRCARTDKGVSALANVISLDVRRIPLRDERNTEIAVIMSQLNRLLPPTIRVTGGAIVNAAFSARFSCKARTYKYFMFDDNMNFDAMNDACQRLVGRHDFRNFCKMDLKNTQVFSKTVIEARVDKEAVQHPSGDVSRDRVWVFTITADGFLHHMVRFTISVLMMVGRGFERPEVIDDLLEVDSCKGKPEYLMASELPLVLFHCAFDKLALDLEPYTTANINLVTLLRAHYRRSQMQSCLWSVFWRKYALGNLNDHDENAQHLLSENTSSSNTFKRMRLIEDTSLHQVDMSRRSARTHVPLVLRRRGKSLDEKLLMLSPKERNVFAAKLSRSEMFRQIRMRDIAERASSNTP